MFPLTTGKSIEQEFHLLVSLTASKLCFFKNCFLKISPKIVPAFNSYYIQLANGHVFYQTKTDGIQKVKLPNNTRIIKIIGDAKNTFFIDSNDDVFVAGENTVDQMGTTPDTSPTRPLLFSGNSELDIQDIVIGNDRTFVQDKTGQWFGYGCNEAGMLGIDPNILCTDIGIPLLRSNIKRIVAGWDHSFFLIGDQWYGAGNARFGVFGIKSSVIEQSMLSIKLEQENRILDIVAGCNTTFFKGESGQWYSSGDNNCSSLGYEAKKDSRYIFKPEMIILPEAKSIKQVVCVSHFTYIEDEEGNWYGYGNGVGSSRGARTFNHLTNKRLKPGEKFPEFIDKSWFNIDKISFGSTVSCFKSGDDWWLFGDDYAEPTRFDFKQMKKIDSEKQTSSSLSL